MNFAPSIPELDVLLHGGRVSPDGFHFDAATRRAAVSVVQLHPDPARTRVDRLAPLMWRLTVSMVVLRIVVDNVDRAVVDDEAQVGKVEIDDVSGTADGVRIECVPPCAFMMSGADPKVRVEVTGHAVGEKTFYRFGRHRPASVWETVTGAAQRVLPCWGEPRR